MGSCSAELEGMLSLESTREAPIRAGGQGRIRHDRPRLLLVDVKAKPGGNAAPDFQPVRMDNLDDYSAPSWKLKVDNWPPDAKIPAHVEAWWSDIGEPDKKYTALIPLDAFNPDGTNQRFNVPPGSLADGVILERMGIEETKELVVRLRCPLKRPMLVRLVSRTGGDIYASMPSVHALYAPDQAGKYVGRFAGWTENWKTSDLALELTDITQFKAEAERVKKHASFEVSTDGPDKSWEDTIKPSYRLRDQ
jgi:hypothetical protein